MKVATTLIIASLFMIAAGSASAEGSLKETGTILAGTPVVLQEHTFPCSTTAPDNGINGVWYDVSDFVGSDFTIDVPDTLDIDPRFYDEGCGFIDNGGAPLGFLGADESGTVSEGSAFLLVWGFAGAGEFTLTIE